MEAKAIESLLHLRVSDFHLWSFEFFFSSSVFSVISVVNSVNLRVAGDVEPDLAELVVILQKSQALTHDLAGRLVEAGLHLLVDAPLEFGGQ